MEEAKRVPIRAAFIEVADQLEAELRKDKIDKVTVLALFSNLENKGQRLFKIDEQVMDDMLFPVRADQDKIDSEFKSAEAYRDRLCVLRTEVDEFVALRNVETESVKGTSESSSNRKFVLPKIEWKRFCGEPKDWLGFWGQFRKIDEDQTIDDDDKFQYLLQAVEKGSRAAELVESYPPDAKCYPKAIESLKDRFGNEDILVEVYVRELLRLVLHNALNPKNKVPLSSLYDRLETQLRALEALGVTSDKYASMLYPLVESCLPEDVLRAWERNRNREPDPSAAACVSKNSLMSLVAFLRGEVRGEERISMARRGFALEKIERAKKPKTNFETEETDRLPTAAGLFSGSGSSKTETKNKACVFCEKMNHQGPKCYEAKKMSLGKKKSILKKKGICFSCLVYGHMTSSCPEKLKCAMCSLNHVSVMCPKPVVRREETNEPKTGETNSSDLANQICSSDVLLQTLVVILLNGKNEMKIRAVIDTGSQRSYLSERVAKEIGYSSIGEETVNHCLFGGTETGGLWTLGEIKRNRISLSDEGNEKTEIDLLIGADVAGKLYTGKKIELTDGPVAIESHLGWTLMGKVPGRKSSKNSTLFVSNLLNQDSSIQDLWRLDVIGITDPVETQTREELQEAALEHFLKTVRVNEEERYEIALPFVVGHECLPSNKRLAEKRMISSTKKILAEDRMNEYLQVFRDWLSEGVIEEVPDSERENFGHYLPHRPVFKNYGTTRVRPVFDASAREKAAPSLNDCLEKGPNLLELIPSVLSRFRKRKIGIVSDIKKAFLQISVRPSDRDFLRFFLWEKTEDGTLCFKELRHRRVVFGVSSSPFLLGAVINLHLDKISTRFEQTEKLLKSSMYVDNCVTSVNSKSELNSFIDESVKVMNLAKFDLRGWEWSGKETDENLIPVLGLLWNLKDDSLSLDLRNFELEVPKITKRSILSVAHRIFDPIGFSAPVTLLPKLLLQETWKLKLGWDVELPEDIRKQFETWMKSLPLLKELKIPRWLLEEQTDEMSWSLHTFVDASKFAYAACVFLRVESKNCVSTQLVLAKTRVSPVKRVTIPRLELLACCIGARLAENVKKIFNMNAVPAFYWTGSSNALSWILKEDQWGTFVAIG